jgi:serine/threonine protein kinase
MLVLRRSMKEVLISNGAGTRTSGRTAGGRLSKKLGMLQTFALLVLSLAALSRPKYQVVVQAAETATATTAAAREKTTTSAIEPLASSEIESSAASRASRGSKKSNHPKERENEDVLVVMAVDGTLAGISRDTGALLWKQSSQQGSHTGAGSSTSSASSGRMQPGHPNRNAPADDDASALLRPLLSTTTTTQSAASSNTAAVPSVDGNVYLTTTTTSLDGSSPSMTVSTSVKELVQRAPFLDPQGRFYVGSRHTTAAAIDKYTGEFLSVISSSANGRDANKDDPKLENRPVLWMGRVDYSVTVQDARTGIRNVQFSVSEIMNVEDMRSNAHSNNGEAAGTSSSSSPGRNGRLDPWAEQWNTLPDGSLPTRDSSSSLLAQKEQTRLISTPSGSLALLYPESGVVQWVAQEQFQTPIAFAMDATTGRAIEVEIIPDVTVPSSNDMEYLSRELERQLELLDAASTEDTGSVEDSDQTIVGRLEGSGQLYALPLGKRRSKMSRETSSVLHSPNQHAAAIAANAASKHKAVPKLTGGRGTTHLTQHASDHHHDSMTSQRKSCHPTSSHFPSCLVDHHKHQPPRLEYFAKGNDNRFLSEGLPPFDDTKRKSHEMALVSQQNPPENVVYHPDYGYVNTNHFAPAPPPKSQYSKILKILGSWLPPTIALIFVLSFELGRRKRLQDETSGTSTDKETPSNLKGPNGEIKDLPKQNNGDTDIVVPETVAVHTSASSLQVQLHQQHVIQVSDQVLGFGGQGTVVYKGVLDGRDVAVKRMLKAYHASADREIRLLIESDGHPSVVRYFLKEVRGDFVYLALELCDMSLHDLIGVLRSNDPSSDPTSSQSPMIPFAASKLVLQQIVSGVRHLHSLRIVHRDLKPANILLAITKNGKKKARKEDTNTYETFLDCSYVAKISDMGLGKQIAGQSSLGGSMMATPSFQGQKGGTSSMGVGPGSVGWQAPEVMALRWVASDASAKSGESNSFNPEASPIDLPSPNPRTSRSVDIFSLGCIFYSTLVPGYHPFGEWYEREANIVHNRPMIDALEKISSDAFHLVRSMLSRDPKLRPTAKQICEHPFFWTSQKKLSFLCEFSDRLETDTTVPTSIQLINSLAIERGAVDVVGTSWDENLDEPLISNMQRFRTYDPSSVRDLLRLIRNKHHHFDELPENFRAAMVANQDTLLEYFEQKFPRLLMHCWNCSRSVLTGDDPLMSKYDIPPAPKIPEQIRRLAATISPPESFIVQPVSDDGQPNEFPESEDGDGEEETDARVPPHSNDGDLIVHNAPGQSPTDKLKGPETSSTESLEPSLVNVPIQAEAAYDVIAWEGSTTAKELNCRGWSRSDAEWARRIDPVFRKKDANLKRAAEDPKFRTRLCNHWDTSMGVFCPMRKKNKCVFAHGPVELRVKEGKKSRWGKLVDKNGDNKNPRHSGGEDTYGAARTIEATRKEEGKWNTGKGKGTKKPPTGGKKKKATPASTAS